MTVLANCEGGVGIEAARRVLEQGGSALDAVEQGIRLVEADPSVGSVGRGGGPRLSGEVECDAALMDGQALRAGSVAALKGFLYPVSVARAVMERLPHVLLVGDGAARFAREIGAEAADLSTPAAKAKHEAWLRKHVPAEVLARWPDVPLAEYAWESAEDYASGGTTAFIALDREGNIGAGTSTSGWARSYPGRVGDTPIIGAGLYCDNRFGACCCTHIGEMALRAATAHSVVLYMKRGASVRDACREAMADLAALRDGVLGPLVIHAVDRRGDSCVLANAELGRESSWYQWQEGGATVLRQAELVRQTR